MKLSRAFLRGMYFAKPATAQEHLEDLIEEGLVLDTVAEAWKRTGQILNKIFNSQILDNEGKRSTNNKF